MRATLAANGQTVTMTSRGWSETFPIGAIPSRLAFYRRLRDRGGKDGKRGPYAAHYEPSIAALEKVEKMVAVLGVK